MVELDDYETNQLFSLLEEWNEILKDVNFDEIQEDRDNSNPAFEPK